MLLVGRTCPTEVGAGHRRAPLWELVAGLAKTKPFAQVRHLERAQPVCDTSGHVSVSRHPLLHVSHVFSLCALGSLLTPKRWRKLLQAQRISCPGKLLNTTTWLVSWRGRDLPDSQYMPLLLWASWELMESHTV